jgi:HEPN domain-containing protein
MRKLAADPEINDEAVGFHAQQAVEKWLKAVIASRAEKFEHTHDLRRLIALLRLDSLPAPFDTRQVVALTEGEGRAWTRKRRDLAADR